MRKLSSDHSGRARRCSSPSRLMRKLPWLSGASGGRSRGSPLVRLTRAAVISSASWEEVEVASSWRDWEWTGGGYETDYREISAFFIYLIMMDP